MRRLQLDAGLLLKLHPVGLDMVAHGLDRPLCSPIVLVAVRRRNLRGDHERQAVLGRKPSDRVDRRLRCRGPVALEDQLGVRQLRQPGNYVADDVLVLQAFCSTAVDQSAPLMVSTPTLNSNFWSSAPASS